MRSVLIEMRVYKLDDHIEYVVINSGGPRHPNGTMIEGEDPYLIVSTDEYVPRESFDYVKRQLSDMQWDSDIANGRVK